MSMPQYIEIVVVGATEEKLSEMVKGASMPNAGIAPKYHLVSLAASNEATYQLFADLDYDRVLYWIALDDESLIHCNRANAENCNRETYGRGFYDQYLPNSVVQVYSNQEFIEETHRIAGAFCATS
ncbi:hypothetical protein [Microbulbifer hainanensis]|uniref:hypothetical protein n=1 Tax=Microbulbifer hainanensis TaxID=2735675 RepID=UPI0018695DCA|nr:hypothetical protein [Microbulbifer hainanensis]